MYGVLWWWQRWRRRMVRGSNYNKSRYAFRARLRRREREKGNFSDFHFQLKAPSEWVEGFGSVGFYGINIMKNVTSGYISHTTQEFISCINSRENFYVKKRLLSLPCQFQEKHVPIFEACESTQVGVRWMEFQKFEYFLLWSLKALVKASGSFFQPSEREKLQFHKI